MTLIGRNTSFLFLLFGLNVWMRVQARAIRVPIRSPFLPFLRHWASRIRYGFLNIRGQMRRRLFVVMPLTITWCYESSPCVFPYDSIKYNGIVRLPKRSTLSPRFWIRSVLRAISGWRAFVCNCHWEYPPEGYGQSNYTKQKGLEVFFF